MDRPARLGTPLDLEEGIQFASSAKGYRWRGRILVTEVVASV